jgi:hypothetical protein
MGVTVLTESRGRKCESSGAQEDLADSRSRMVVTRVEWRGDAYGVHYSWAVWWFGPQNHRCRFHGFGPQKPGGGSKQERTSRDGIEELASRRSYLMKGAVAIG